MAKHPYHPVTLRPIASASVFSDHLLFVSLPGRTSNSEITVGIRELNIPGVAGRDALTDRQMKIISFVTRSTEMDQRVKSGPAALISLKSEGRLCPRGPTFARWRAQTSKSQAVPKKKRG